MVTLFPIVSLMAVVTLGLIITRIASSVLRFTGISREMARFQARSAFTGCGFTTTEAEQIVGHPVRRRVIMSLMLLGNAGIVTAVVSMLSLFEGTQGSLALTTQLLLVVFGLLVLWMVSRSPWVDRQIYRATRWALLRFTDLEIHDYHGLLHIAEGYSVTEMTVHPHSWLAGKTLAELRLPDEGVQVLGIRRASHEFVGAPTGNTYVRQQDVLILYGKSMQISELEHRPADTAGDRAHEASCADHERELLDQDGDERSEPRGDSEPMPVRARRG